MADKEERICVFIERPDVPCASCGRIQGEDCLAECGDMLEFNRKHPAHGGVYTRQEAIKRMTAGIEKYKNEGGLFCEGYAKAALNALLEEK